jgi:hypothetical protein
MAVIAWFRCSTERIRILKTTRRLLSRFNA